MNESGSGSLKQTDTHQTAIKTSQTDFSLCEGKSGGAVTVDSKVQEGSQGRGDFTRTSQQINGEYSLPGSPSVKVQ